MICSDLSRLKGYQESSISNDHQAICWYVILHKTIQQTGETDFCNIFGGSIWIHFFGKIVIVLPTSRSFSNIVYLVHLPLVSHKCASESGQHWFRLWLVAFSVPSHYLSQCWNIVNWIPRKNILIEIDIFSFKKIHLKMSSGRWWPFCLGHSVLMAETRYAYFLLWYRVFK